MPGAPSRKLAAILHADVVGSTSLVQKDESLAHQRIQEAFHRLSETVSAYGGAAHEIRGDALVAEFSRASDAVCAAIKFQASNTDHNTRIEDDIRPEIRVGISLGEVVIADATVTGAGVVLAQRLEQLAEPNGVVVQGSVSETVPARMPFDFNSLGEQTLKGFDHPVRAFEVSLKVGEVVPEPESVSTGPQAALSPTDDVTDRPPPELPGKPSIAVLPFENMSGDPEQEYFSDGITEDIITELSRFPTLFVIARHSSFAYKGKQFDITEVGQALGVQYVLEGSVRRAGKRVRITAQLVETQNGNHVWAERFDRDLEELFEVQDEVTRSIASTLPGRIDSDQVERTHTQRIEFGAYDYLLQANKYINRFRPDDNAKARELLLRSLELDAQQARAYTGLAWCYLYEYIGWIAEDPEHALSVAFEHAERGVSLNDLDAECHRVFGMVQTFRRQYDAAERHLQRARSLNPNLAETLVSQSILLFCTSRADEAIVNVREAMRFNPHYPDYYLWVLGMAYYTARRYEKCIETLVEISNPNFNVRRLLAASYAQLGKLYDAQREAKALMEVMRSFTITRAMSTIPFKDAKDGEHYVIGMRKAGLPE